MNNETLKENIIDYINQTQWAILATVRGDLAPVQRVMGSFALDGLDILFSTRIQAGKVEQIAQKAYPFQ